MNIGKVVLIPFPWDDFTITKRRSVVCLSEPRGEFRHLTLVFIGSRIPSEMLDTDVVISEDDPEFALTGLRKTSIIRVHRLISAPTKSIIQEIGRLSDRHVAEIAHKLNILFPFVRQALINRVDRE